MTARILCNLPLECFEDRAAFGDVELVTFGPTHRMWVDGVHYPFDIAFDASTGCWDDLARLLPRGFQPDFVLFYWPDQEPLPADMHRCPLPVVGVISDYNLTLPYLAGLRPFFDVLLCDRAGVDLFRNLAFPDVRWFCQYTFKRPFHRIWPDVERRDLDVAFVGNLNPDVQRNRAPWIDRVRRLDRLGVAVAVRSGIRGEAYGRFLNRARIGWNRSIRSEMNLRAFEVPACGALLFLERDNLEVRDFLTPGEEVVLYADDDFEELVREHLADEPKRARMARAGHERIQQFAMGRRLQALCDLLATPGPGRPKATDADAALARAVAMLPTWAPGPATATAAVAACHLLPGDPRALNALAIATLRWRGAAGGEAVLQLLRRAMASCSAYLPAARNVAELLTASDRPDLLGAAREETRRRASAVREWSDLDGPVLPMGFSSSAVDRSLRLQDAVRAGDARRYAAALVGDPD